MALATPSEKVESQEGLKQRIRFRVMAVVCVLCRISRRVETELLCNRTATRSRTSVVESQEGLKLGVEYVGGCNRYSWR